MSNYEIPLWTDSYLDTLESTTRHPLLDRMRSDRDSWLNVTDLPEEVRFIPHLYEPELLTDFDRLVVERREIGRHLFIRCGEGRA